MSIIPVAIFMISILVGTLILWPLSVLIHEIGHAIPMLLFSKKSVLICVWNREKSNKFLEFNVNRLNFKISYDSLFVSGFAQMCEEQNIAKWKIFIIDLWGPLFSLFICVFLFFTAVYSDIHGFLKLLSVGFLMNTIIHLVLMFQYHIHFAHPYYQFSDGANLYHNIFKNFGSIEVNNALYKYYSQDFEVATKLMKPIYENGFTDFYFFHAYLISLCYSNSPSKAYEIYSLSLHKNDISPLEKSQFGSILLIKGNENGKQLILEAFDSGSKDDTILANKAYLSLSEGNYTNAIAIFTYLCGSESFKSYAKSNLILAKYLGKLENIGLEDFDKCLLDFPFEAYAFRNKGIYLYEHENYKDAIKCFRRAMQLDPNCFQVDAFFDKCLTKLSHKIDNND